MSDLLEKAKIMSSKNTSNVNMNQVQSTKICPPMIPSSIINAHPQRTVYNPIVSEEPIMQHDHRPSSMIPVNTEHKDIDEHQLLKEKSKRIAILESLLNIHKNKHQIISGQVICKQDQLEELVRVYTDADSVEIMTINDGDCGCCVNDQKMYDIEGIIVNIGGKSLDLRFGFNDIYADIIHHGISLKYIIA